MIQKIWRKDDRGRAPLRRLIELAQKFGKRDALRTQAAERAAQFAVRIALTHHR
jgi:hypothetical protein